MEKQLRKRRRLSLIRWIIWVLLVQFILVNISASLYAYNLTHVSDDPSLRNIKPSPNIFAKTWILFSGPRQPRSFITETPDFPVDTIRLKTPNGILIDSWYGKTDSTPKGSVLLFHGLASNKGMILAEAKEFRNMGYNVMLVDFRAHGNSGGNTITYGMREVEEVKLAYDYVMQKSEKNIILWGSSMGAVVVAKAIADYKLKPLRIILEMPFASLQSHLKATARDLGFGGFPQKPFSFFVACWMGIERGFNGLRFQTTHYAASINCPVLMQWGALDNAVLQDETDKVFLALASINKKLVIYDHAGHESLLQNDPLKWRFEVGKFLREAGQQAY